jgi:putative ABC transport system permease protein
MLKHYLTGALTHLRRHKVTTAINILCLTIGLVCFLANYTIITYLESGDRHYADSDRIYLIHWRTSETPFIAYGSFLAARYLKSDFPQLEAVARVTVATPVVNEVPLSFGDRKRYESIAYADPEFLDIFALPFLAGDSRQALRPPRSAVVTRGFAEEWFGSVQAAVGQQLSMQDGSSITVRGVIDRLPQPSHLSEGGDAAFGIVRFNVLISMDVFEAIAATTPVGRAALNNWAMPAFLTYAKLPADGSLTGEALRGGLKEFGARHANANGADYEFDALAIGGFWLGQIGAMTGSGKAGSSATVMFYFLSVLVLAISCFNYANLATAQATGRAKEIGMRRVVGARRGQIAAQFMLEAALSSLAALVIAVAVIGTLLRAFPLPGFDAILSTVVASAKFWLTLFLMLSVVTVAAGIYPAFVLSSVRPVQAVRTGKARGGRAFVPQLLVGLQFAAASFLVISMLVMHTQNTQMRRLALSGSADAMLIMSNSLHAAGIDFDVFARELARQPHVQVVTASATSPWTMLSEPYTVSSSRSDTARRMTTTMMSVNHGFFATMRMRIVAGRDFSREQAFDNASGAGATNGHNVVIDAELAEANGWLRREDALGKTLYASDAEHTNTPGMPVVIIGVVEHRPMSIISPVGNTSSMYRLAPALASYPIIRISTTDTAEAQREIESVWERLAPTVALKMRFASEELQRSYWFVQILAGAFSSIAFMALAIAILGLIGISLHTIGRRQHEIGVRKTLGASASVVVRMLLMDFSKPVIVANLLAWPLVFVTMSAYLSLFTQRTALSPAVFVTGLAITVLIAWIAVAAQAMRAARLKPAGVLRYE